MDEKIKSLTDAINNTTESEKSKKIDTINTALKALVLDWKFSVPKKDNPTEQESKTFDGNINNDEIASIIESLIKDEPDQAKKNQYKSDLTAALQWARDALKTLASESQIRQAIENETTQTSDSLSGLATEVNDNMHIYSTQELAKFVEAWEKKGKSRKELRATPWYIRTIQNLILELWAQDPSIDKKKLEDGIYGNATEAWVLTIQKILNKPPYNSYKNLIEDGKPGPFTLWALLYPIDGKITWDKLLEDKKSGKLIITPELVQKKEISATKAKKDNKSSTKAADPEWWPVENKNPNLTKDKNGKRIPKKGFARENYKDKNNLEVKELSIKNNIIEKITTLKQLPENYTWAKENNVSFLYTDIITNIEYRFFSNGRVSINVPWKKTIMQYSKETIKLLNDQSKEKNIIIKNLWLKKFEWESFRREWREWIYFFDKDNTLHYLEEWFNMDSWQTLSKWSDNRINHINRDNNIDKILSHIWTNPVACAQLIDMATAGWWTYDNALKKILNHLIKLSRNWNKIAQETSRYYDLIKHNNPLDNNDKSLLEIISEETKKDENSLFNSFFIDLLQYPQYNTWIKNTLLRKKIYFTSNKIFNHNIFKKRRENNNIEWDINDDRHSTK